MLFVMTTVLLYYDVIHSHVRLIIIISFEKKLLSPCIAACSHFAFCIFVSGCQPVDLTCALKLHTICCLQMHWIHLSPLTTAYKVCLHMRTLCFTSSCPLANELHCLACLAVDVRCHADPRSQQFSLRFVL